MGEIIARTFNFVSNTIIDTIKMLTDNLFYVNDKMTIFGKVFFMYLGITIFSVIMEILFNFILGALENKVSGYLSTNFGVENEKDD